VKYFTRHARDAIVPYLETTREQSVLILAFLKSSDLILDVGESRGDDLDLSVLPFWGRNCPTCVKNTFRSGKMQSRVQMKDMIVPIFKITMDLCNPEEIRSRHFQDERHSSETM
jgi:hypothetical protein